MIRAACLAVLLTIVSASPLFAQFPGLGVKGGVNLASQKTSGEDAGDDELTSFPAFVAGAFTTYRLGWLEVQPEVLYSVKGSRFEENGFTATALIDYIEVPLLARITVRRDQRPAFYAAGGPYAAFQVRARTKMKFSASTEYLDSSDQVERSDFGLSVGGGMEWGHLVFDGRYVHGLKDVDKDRSDRIKFANRAISITGGYRF